MNNIDLLTSQVELYPTNPIVCSMLVDELMSERDMNRSEAEAHVKRVTEVAIDAMFLRRAAELVSGCAWQRAWVHDTIAEALPSYIRSMTSLLLIAGLAPPTETHREQLTDDPFWGVRTVTVGAQWVCREYRELLAFRREHNAEVRAKRKH